MNNMPSVDSIYKGDKWEVKHQFLSPYKFTIAFENYVYPGYQKLLGPVGAPGNGIVSKTLGSDGATDASLDMTTTLR